MSFIPVYLRQKGSAIMKPHASDAFPFPPATATVDLAQSCNFPNGRADNKSLNMRNLSKDLEVHRRMISKDRDAVKLPSNVELCGVPATIRSNSMTGSLFAR